MSITAAATRTSPSLSMKLLIDTTTRRVLFAEANKDVVDFLFSLLTLPIGTVVDLLGKDSMVGSAGDLYRSVIKIDIAYILPDADLEGILLPTVSSQAAAPIISLLHLPDPSPKWLCGDCKRPGYVVDVRGTSCPTCRTPMKVEIECVRPDSGGVNGRGAKGFVQGGVTYTVTDNLTVTPMSAISSMTLLNTFGISHFGALQEKTVRLGSSEGLAILRASLESKTVLTDVFLGKKRKA